MLCTEKWKKLEIIMLSEIRKTEKDKHCTFSFIGRTRSLQMNDRNGKQGALGMGTSWRAEGKKRE
jgi:hypothetical protein